MLVAHHAYAAALATITALLADEDQILIFAGVFGLAVVLFHLGRTIPRGAGRLQVLAWLMPLAAAVTVAVA